MLDTHGPGMLDSGSQTMPEEPSSPYLPPQAEEAAPPPMPDHPPSMIKAFGNLHLVLAGMEVLGGISAGMIFIGKMGRILDGSGGDK